MNNFHVVVIHFPIALLTLYAVLEILRFRRLQNWQPMFYIKAVLAILGALSAWAAVITGQMLTGFSFFPGLLGLHQKFAIISAIIFSVIAAFYKIAWRGRVYGNWKPRLAASAEKFIGSFWMPILALIGLGCITLTGAFGGAMAFGSNVDPWTPFILRLFGVPVN